MSDKADPEPRLFRTHLSAFGMFRSESPYFEVIGRISVEWGSFEAALDRLIWVLSGTTRQTCAAITSQINGPVPRLRAILSLLELKGVFPDLLSDMNQFMQRTHGIADERNRVLHDPWLFEHRDQTVEQARSARIGKKFVHDYKPVTIEGLNEIGRRINEHALKLVELQVRIQDDPARPHSGANWS